MPRPNRHRPDIFQRMEQSRNDRDANVGNSDRGAIARIPLDEIRGHMNRTLNQDFHISQRELENHLDLRALEMHINTGLHRRLVQEMVSGRGSINRPFLTNGDPFHHSGTVTGRMSSNGNIPRMTVPKINTDKLKEAFAMLGKTKIVLDSGLPTNYAAWMDDNGAPVQVGETHISPEDTTEFNLPWVQGPQPEKIGKDGNHVGKQRSDRSYVFEEGKRIYAYTMNEDGQRIRQFIAQTNSPRIARYIIDACNAYAKEASAMGQNSAVIAANLRRELQEIKLVNSQGRVRFARELAQFQSRITAQARDHEAKIKEMQREIAKAQMATKLMERQRDTALRELDERKQKTLDEFKATDTLAGRRIRFRKENSDELAR